MRLFTKKGTVAAFYYLMAADGEIGSAEQEKLRQIAAEIELEGFESCLEEIQAEFENRQAGALNDDEPYDLLSEGVDDALAENPTEEENGVTPRLLLWDLLVMANADGQYHPQERRLIRHVARTIGVEKSVFLEMEQLLQSDAAITRELAWLAASNRPYTEIRPLVEEMETRQAVLRREAELLIADEVSQEVAVLEYKPDIVDKAKEKIMPAAAEIGEKTGHVISEAKDRFEKAASPLAENIGKQAGKLFSGLKGRMKKNAAQDEATEEGED